MNKAILMSIQSKWLVKILNGEKTIEIRKLMPKCELPIDVYLYCTKGKPYIPQQSRSKYTKLINGKVVAKFTLNKVEEITLIADDIIGYDDDAPMEYGTVSMCLDELLKSSCLSYEEAHEYLDNAENGYAYHIDNLVIFDKPKELSEFSIFKRETISCGMDCPPYTDWVEYRVRKAPQSWQYIWLK